MANLCALVDGVRRTVEATRKVSPFFSVAVKIRNSQSLVIFYTGIYVHLFLNGICEIEDCVEIHLGKLRGILRSRCTSYQRVHAYPDLRALDLLQGGGGSDDCRNDASLISGGSFCRFVLPDADAGVERCTLRDGETDTPSISRSSRS